MDYQSLCLKHFVLILSLPLILGRKILQRDSWLLFSIFLFYILEFVHEVLQKQVEGRERPNIFIIY